jgi:ABC-type polysaccharide/polyol phosphate transport system ATPase subunit
LTSENFEIIKLRNIKKIYKIHHNTTSTILERISKLFSRDNLETRTILENVNISIKQGEFIGIIGKNGSGKSTLLKIIAGIIPPTEGDLSVNGTIAPFLSLGSSFNPELDARENIILYGMLLGFSKKSIKSKINEILQFAELEKYSDVKLKTFSTGMFMRLAFSVAITLDPDILLIDEVLAVGDEGFQQKSFNKLISFKEKGKTIIFVSHALDQIQNMSDKVILIHDGGVHSMGNPKEIIENYKKLNLE